MIKQICPVVSVERVAGDIYVLTFQSEELVQAIKPGQFVNIRVQDSYVPFLRRPFSAYKVEQDCVKIIFNVIGIGTRILSSKRRGDVIDVLGPLGRAYNVEGDYETAILVAGGMGVAPLPMITDAIFGKKNIITLLGAKTKSLLIDTYLQNVHIATDDGSKGFRGTVIELLSQELLTNRFPRPKIFACGPSQMLQSLTLLIETMKLPCEVSIESIMACGIGICQGCPVELINGEDKYALVCKDGPVFDISTIKLGNG